MRVSEVEPMDLQVGLTLRLIPLESHLQSVYTIRGWHNARRRRLTPQFSGGALS